MKKFLTIVLLFFVLISFSYSKDKMVIAVSPFENLSGNKSESYIGFQISEYMTSALASIDNVTVVERGLLEKVLNEQNLQLLGMTEDKNAVKLGNLVNAKQMLIGTYTINRNTINIKGRIVDVESAEITASANISGSYTGNINPVMYDFFYALLEKNPPEEVFSHMSVLEQRISKLESEKNESFAAEIKALQDQLTNLENEGVNLEDTISSLKISLAVEAQLSMLKDMDQGASIDAAKALEASFASNDKKALEYLQSAIADPTKNYLSYSLSADSYYEKLSAVEGESFFVKMVKNQLEVNKVLSQDAEAISKYRNTLKLLVNRLYSVLHQDMFTLEVGKDEQIEMGTVSAIITLPSDISINVNKGAQKLLNRVLETQDIIGRKENVNYRTGSTSDWIEFNKEPPVLKNLLPNIGIKQLFPINLNAGVGYSIQFIDKNENVLFELLHDNLNSFNFATDSTTVWGKNSDNSYSVKVAKDGWSFRNGKVEVQARELKNLQGVRVVLDRSSFTMDYSFPMYSDTKWKSVLLHAYRQKYIKIALGDVEDPMPQVKDIVVTHSVFSVGNYLDGIPLIVDPDYVAGIADLTAVVYWGDSSNTVVTGEWSGVKNYSNENFSGTLNSESVLYFPITSIMKTGSGIFTISNNGQKKRITFNSVIGNTWKNKDVHGNDIPLVSGNQIFIDHFCLDADTGKINWRSYDNKGIWDTYVSDKKVYNSYANDIACFDADTGKRLWVNTDIGGVILEVSDNYLYTAPHYVGGQNAYTSCLEKDTGKILWTNYSIGRSTDLQMSGNRVYIACRSYTTCIDASTGKILWKNSDIGGNNLQITGSRLYTSSEDDTVCIDINTGKTLWKNSYIGSNNLQVRGSWVYAPHDDYIACLDVGTGRILWKNSDIGFNSLQVSKNLVYAVDNRYNNGYIACLDSNTGKIMWINSDLYSDNLQVIRNGIYTANTNYTAFLDITVLEPWYEYKKNGDAFYNKDNYFGARDQYSKAIIEEGCIDGIILYRYAYSLEKLDGLTPEIKRLYFQAWVRLKEQYPDHRYIASAQGKMK